MAGYVMHTPTGLSTSDEIRAAELGPSDVASPAATEELAHTVGLATIVHKDVTDVLTVTYKAILETREKLEEELRAEEGDEVYDEETKKKHAMLDGIADRLASPFIGGVGEVIITNSYYQTTKHKRRNKYEY
jgi:hypothetical protein